MLLELRVMLTVRMEQHLCNILSGYAMLEMEITLFLQWRQKELIGGAVEEEGIRFVGIPFRERFAVFLIVWEWEIDASNVNEIENIVQRDEIDVILWLVQMNLCRRSGAGNRTICIWQSLERQVIR